MSRALLESFSIRAEEPGPLTDWLNRNPGEPRIAWYPSSGSDLKDLLTLHRGFRKLRPAIEGAQEPEPPNFFIHTDILGGNFLDNLVNEIVFEDERTTIRVVSREELWPLPLHVYPEMLDPCRYRPQRLVFMILGVVSRQLGEFECPLLYAKEENIAFCAYLLEENASISHLVQVLYGHRFGGTQIGPSWLRYQLRRLCVEVLITDGQEQLEDDVVPIRVEEELEWVNPNCFSTAIIQRFPILNNPDIDPNALHQIRTLPETTWRGFGPVSWFKIIHHDEELPGQAPLVEPNGPRKPPRPNRGAAHDNDGNRGNNKLRLARIIRDTHQAALDERRDLPGHTPNLKVPLHCGMAPFQHIINGQPGEWLYAINQKRVRVYVYFNPIVTASMLQTDIDALEAWAGAKGFEFNHGVALTIAIYVDGGWADDPAEYKNIAIEAIRTMERLWAISRQA